MRPSGHVNPLDIQVMKQLGSRVNLVPIIAKGDTISKADLQGFKSRIMDAITQHDIKVYTPPVDGDPDDDAPAIISAMPFSVICSTTDVKVGGKMVKGREYGWGVAEGIKE
jgi:cell division control protein 12